MLKLLVSCVCFFDERFTQAAACMCFTETEILMCKVFLHNYVQSTDTIDWHAQERMMTSLFFHGGGASAVKK